MRKAALNRYPIGVEPGKCLSSLQTGWKITASLPEGANRRCSNHRPIVGAESRQQEAEPNDSVDECCLNNASSYSWLRGASTGSSLHAPPATPCPLGAPPALLQCSSLLPRYSPFAPLLLPLKRPCSRSGPGKAIPDPQFGGSIIYIYMHTVSLYFIGYLPYVKE